MTRRSLALAFAGLLAACSQAPPPPVTVAVSPPPPALAPECLAADPAWIDLPDADVTQSVAARTWRANKGRYRTLLMRREICRVSIRAQGLAPAAATAPRR